MCHAKYARGTNIWLLVCEYFTTRKACNKDKVMGLFYAKFYIRRATAYQVGYIYTTKCRHATELPDTKCIHKRFVGINNDIPII